jgi:hypothetical protein
MSSYASAVAAALLLTTGAAMSPPDVVLDLINGSPSPQTILSTQVCVGLMNRDDKSHNGIYTLMDEYDAMWLYDIFGVSNPRTTPINEFMMSCLSSTALVNGHILYEYNTQQAIVPNLITLAAVLNATLLEKDQAEEYASNLVYDATVEWYNYTPYDATKFMYDKYVNQTSTLAYMNPGYDNAANPSDPPLTKSPNLKLTDYIVKEKLFNMYLNDGCIRGSDEYALLEEITAYNTWPK